MIEKLPLSSEINWSAGLELRFVVNDEIVECTPLRWARDIAYRFSVGFLKTTYGKEATS